MDYKTRMIKEQKDLKQKIEKAEAYLFNDSIHFTKEGFIRLSQQIVLMKGYSEILEQRILND